MEIVTKVTELQKISKNLRRQGKVIGFVPTMGYLHKGHSSLMQVAKENADIVITSIFVNPIQFAPNEDYQRYPRNFERDEKIARENFTDYLFYPDEKEMYPDGYSTAVIISGISKKFEGEKRPNHFNGVATIVAKLFNCCNPDIAVFGQKDYQQTLVIKQLVKDLNFDIKIIVAPTVREEDGLAMSSRNTYLLQDERQKASIIYKSLEAGINAIKNGERKRKVINAIMHNTLRSVPEIRIDYASSADAETLNEPEEFSPGQLVVLLIAVYLGKTRLIDNALVSIPTQVESNVNFKEGIV